MTGKFISIKDFARFSRLTRVALRHYEAIGLLPPLLRGKNKYRYYSTGQLGAVNLIRISQKLGMKLREIKKLKDRRSPELTDALLTELLKKIDDTITDWFRARKLLLTFQKSIHSVSQVDAEAITIQHLPAEAIILGEENDYSNGRDDYDALLSFYNTLSARYLNLDLEYPVWAVFSEERIQRGNWQWPTRYYFYNPEGPDQRPAGQYAVGYSRGTYGQGKALFKRMIDYIDANGFEICGDAYEEYPLNEFCIADEANYLRRIMITVREKK